MWTDTSPQKIHRLHRSIWRDALHYISLWKFKWKPQWDTTTHLLEWPQSKPQTRPDVGEDVGQEELPFPVGQDAGRCSPFGRQRGSSFQSWTYSYCTIQQLCSVVFTPRNWKRIFTHNLHTMCIAASFTIAKTLENQDVLQQVSG